MLSCAAVTSRGLRYSQAPADTADATDIACDAARCHLMMEGAAWLGEKAGGRTLQRLRHQKVDAFRAFS